jgi:hypothetical protein
VGSLKQSLEADEVKVGERGSGEEEEEEEEEDEKEEEEG